MKATAIFTVLFLFASNVLAQGLRKHGPSPEQIKEMAIHNQKMARQQALLGPLVLNSNIKPFYEFDKTGYILMSDDDFGGMAREMKKVIAQNLPQDVKLIVYTQSTNRNYQNQLRATYSQYVPQDRLIILEVPRSGSSDFWTRDNTPVPIWENGRFALVDAKYYYYFEPDAFLNQLFQGTLLTHNYYYEGGNFTTNSRGECLVVNRKAGLSDTAAIPDDVFKAKYGCKTLTRFRHLKGIGHSDEVVKFMTDDIVVTDTAQYVPVLERAGYRVHLLPEAELDFETYVNSLIVNDVLYVPIFGEQNDQSALQVYRNLNLGYKIVPINSRDLSTEGRGSIHCITMNYPAVPMNVLTNELKGSVVSFSR
ncbi:MAG: agmatine deiminase family protein [Bdellovibrionales bacterium]